MNGTSPTRCLRRAAFLPALALALALVAPGVAEAAKGRRSIDLDEVTEEVAADDGEELRPSRAKGRKGARDSRESAESEEGESKASSGGKAARDAKGAKADKPEKPEKPEKGGKAEKTGKGAAKDTKDSKAAKDANDAKDPKSKAKSAKAEAVPEEAEAAADVADDAAVEEEAERPRTEPPPARREAAKGPKLVVIPAVAGEEAARLAELFTLAAERAVGRAGRHTLVELIDALDPSGSDARAARVRAAEQKIETGRQAFEVDLEMSTAIEFYSRAISDYEAAGFDRTWTDATLTWTRRVAARLGDGDVSAAKADLVDLFRVDPKRKLDRSLFVPEVLTLAREVKEENASREVFSLGISTGSVPARVWVDGVYVGVSPVDLKKVGGGEHWVTLRAPGHEFQQKVVVVRAGSAETFTLKPLAGSTEFFALRDALAAKPTSDELIEKAEAMAKGLGAEQLLIVAAKRQGGTASLSLSRIALKDGHYLAYAETVLPVGDPKVLEILEEQVVSALSTDAPRGSDGEPLRRRSLGSGWSRRHTAWTAIGAGAAAVGAGVYFGLSALASQDEIGGYAQPDPKVDELAASAYTQAVVADVLYGVAAVGVGLGTYLLLSDGPTVATAAPTDTEDAAVEQPGSQPAPAIDGDDPFSLAPPAPAPFAFSLELPGGLR